MNEIDDIEKLLQQYGSDKRQQQQAAEHLRHKARRQARSVTAVASVAVLLAIAGVVGYRLQQPKPQGPMMAEMGAMPATQKSAASSAEETMAVKAEEIYEAAPRQPREAKGGCTLHEQQSFSPLQPYAEALPLPTISAEDTVRVPRDIEPSMQLRQELQAANIMPTQPVQGADGAAAELRRSLAQDARWHFTAAVGTAMMGGTPLGGMTFPDAMTSANTSYSIAYAAPNSQLQAKVGVDCRLWGDARQRLSVGLVLDGYAQPTDVHFQDVEYCMVPRPNYVADGQDFVTNVATTDEIYSKNMMSLFVGVPLSYDFYPRGADKLGCQLSLTPARSLAATPSKYALINPWKLTLGVGVLFPRGFIDHLSLTANVLPIYQTNTMHEFGVLIGF